MSTAFSIERLTMTEKTRTPALMRPTNDLPAPCDTCCCAAMVSLNCSAKRGMNRSAIESSSPSEGAIFPNKNTILSVVITRFRLMHHSATVAISTAEAIP